MSKLLDDATLTLSKDVLFLVVSTASSYTTCDGDTPRKHAALKNFLLTGSVCVCVWGVPVPQVYGQQRPELW